MSLYVVKFGGSSIATNARIEHVSELISGIVSGGHKVAVVTSAMYGVTNKLIDFTKQFCRTTFDREYDAVISSGEQVAAGLLALCLKSKNVPAKSMNAWQIPIRVSGNFSDAIIKNIDTRSILSEIEQGVVPVITGFQGISKNGDICTIGRGGSDATACAIANAISAEECLIYTDVDGVYSADPRIVLNSKRLTDISYDEMIALASGGAKVLQAKSAVIAKQYGVKLRVLSSFSDGVGTYVTNHTSYVSKNNKIAGIASNTNVSMLSLTNYHFDTDVPAHLQHIKSENGVDTFIFQKSAQSDVESVISNSKDSQFEFDNDIGIITIVGDNIGADLQIKDELLAKASNYLLKFEYSSNNFISIVVPFQQTDFLVNDLHKHFFE